MTARHVLFELFAAVLITSALIAIPYFFARSRPLNVSPVSQLSGYAGYSHQNSTASEPRQEFSADRALEPLSDIGRINSTSLSMTTAQWNAFQKKLDCWTAAGSYHHDPKRREHDPDHPHREEYVWVPTCTLAPLPEFSRSRFCDTLRGRNVLFLGDSMTRDFHWYLQMVASHNPPDKLMGNEFVLGYSFRNDSAVCHDSRFGPSRVLLASVSRLHDHPRGRDATQLRASEYFCKLVLEANVRLDAIVLNRGMWVSSDSEVLGDIDDALRAIQSCHPHALIIWRSTPTPVPECSNFSAPIASPIPRARLIGVGSGAVMMMGDYRWPDVHNQQPLIRKFLADRWPGVVFMDVGPAMDLRADAHPANSNGRNSDCVHFSSKPGAMNVWVRFLHAILHELDPFLQLQS
jgi:hypothetical protein